MHVVIETPMVGKMRLRIAKTDRVRRIKEKIEKRLPVAVPAASQVLSTNGQVMADDDAVACRSFSLQEDARIQLTIKNLKLTVTSPDGTKNTAVEVKATDAVRILRKKLDFPLPSTCGYFYAHQGKPLCDDGSFGGQGVENGDTIQVAEDYFDYDKFEADQGASDADHQGASDADQGASDAKRRRIH